MTYSETFVSEYYDQKCERYGVGHKALGWVSRETQWARYEQVIPWLTEEITSVLDVGCGQGDFVCFLKEQGWSGEYTGIDLSSKMIDLAKEKHADQRFDTISLSELKKPQSADLVVAFGTFSLKEPDGKRPKLIQRFQQIFERTNKVAVINLLSTFAEESRNEDSRFAYFDPMQTLSVALNLTRKAQVIHGALPNDLTVVLSK